MRNTSRPTDDLPHIWVVSITRLARLFRDVTPEFDDQARIEAIDLGFEEAVREVRKRLRRQSCDVILAAGSNGAYLKARVDVPVVLVESSGFDVMAAMVRARKLSPHVALVTHQNAPPEFSAFADSFGLEVQHRVFSTHEDARDVVAELAALGVDVVVGTGLVSDVAEAAGLKSVLLYSASSVRTGFAQALSICQATRNPASARPTLAARAPRPRPPRLNRKSAGHIGGHAAAPSPDCRLRPYAGHGPAAGRNRHGQGVGCPGLARPGPQSASPLCGGQLWCPG